MEVSHYEVQFKDHRGEWYELTMGRPTSIEEAREFYKIQREETDPELSIRIVKIRTITEVVPAIYNGYEGVPQNDWPWP